MKKIFFTAAITLFSMSISAANLSFTGNFNNDNTRFYTTFNVTQSSSVSLTSFGYAGGTNGAGTVIADGGFDSQLFLFDSTGALLASDDDGSSVVSASSGLSWDAFISMTLAVDSYTAVLTQFNSDYQSGDLVTGIWSSAGVTNFVDVGGNQRTNAYAFDISGDYIDNVNGFNTNAVPVPAALFMFAPALLGFMGLRRKACA